MKDVIAVGIDISGSLARMVYGYSKEGEFYLLAWHSFRDTKRFERCWKAKLEAVPRKPSSFQVAMPSYPYDSLDLGIAKWLEAKGIPVYRTAITGDACQAHFEHWGLPRTFGPAYDLALSAAYELDAPAILKGQWLTLESLTRELQQLSLELGRLSTARVAAHERRSGSPATNGVARPQPCPF